MVYIHGESYEWNSGNPYDGTVLASYGRVVVVTVNFRLGVLGFLKPKMLGRTLSNFALLDQAAALHWVKHNIANFGGDPEAVTVFGHGTGAALVNLLLISPVTQASRGLVRRAILMSGSALSRWALTYDPYKYTAQMAEALDCPTSDLRDGLITCLRRKSVRELLSVNLQTKPFYTPLGPVVDGVIIKKDPLKSMREDTGIFGKFDLMYGVTRAESFHMLGDADSKNGFSVHRRNHLVNAYVSNNYENFPGMVLSTVTSHYTSWDKSAPTDPREVRDLTMDLMSDAQIKAPVMQMADLHSDIHQKSFLYVFNHQSAFGDYPQSHGAIHGEELAYVFGAPLVGGFNHFGLNYTLQEKLLSELVMIYWTNFAKTGNPNLPTPQSYRTPGASRQFQENMKVLWPAYEKQQQQYLHIDMEVKRKDRYRANYIAVWNKVIPNLLVTSPPTSKPETLVTPSTFYSWTTVFLRQEPPTLPDNHIPIHGIRGYNTELTEKPRRPFEPKIIPGPPTELPQVTPTSSNPPPQAAGTPMSIVILVGICILIVNCCAMGGVYYQRDKIRHQSRLLRKTLRRKKSEEPEEKTLEAPVVEPKKEKTHKKKGSGINFSFDICNEVLPDGISRSSGPSRESSMKRKEHRSMSQSSSSKPATPKPPSKSSKSPKSGHKRHKSDNSMYSEIGKVTEVEVHGVGTGSSLSRQQRKNPTVKFNTLGSGLPPKAVTKSTTSISSRASIKSNTSRASVKSTASRTSAKSTTSEKRLKKNASCQSLPTAEYSWGITPEMTMTQRDDPEGHADLKDTPADRQQTVLAMQKLNYPKVLPDHPPDGHHATLPRSRPPPPPRSTSLTSRDIQELEESIHVVYRKKKPPRRDASTDSCDLSGMDNIYLMGTEVGPPASMYGAPAATATVNKARVRKSDGADYARDYGDYSRQGAVAEYLRAVPDVGRAAPVDFSRPPGGPLYGSYTPYDPTYLYKDSGEPGPKAPIAPKAHDMAKTYGSYSDQRTPNRPLATFGKTCTYPAGEPAPQPDYSQSRPPQETSPLPAPPHTSPAAVTAAAQTALAAATAPAFVGASVPTRTASPKDYGAPPPAAMHTSALRQQSSTTSSSDATTVYEQTENTGTIKRKKTKGDTASPATLTPPQIPSSPEPDKPYEKPLKSALKQTSAYDRPKPLMARAPGASPPSTSTSASSLSSSSTNNDPCDSDHRHVPLNRTPSAKRSARVATPAVRRKGPRQDNHTTTTTIQTDP
ncbi:hypothetical protein O3P69_007601 [Scylla paramamosain]|uniref:Carboxylesterase type B domain-containing protein n=1 Tax=Scylla paramamosain TaxID=85552 RepID=A0AAW0UWA4_SCYPA